MTTIVYRDGVLAADSRAYGGDKVPIGHKVKIHRLECGTRFGCSTTSVGGDKLVRHWIEGGCERPSNEDLAPESFDLLLVNPKGEVFFAHNNFALTGPLSAPYFAIGSGNEFAMGALAMGASAERAVQVAIELDPWSGGPISTILDDPF